MRSWVSVLVLTVILQGQVVAGAGAEPVSAVTEQQRLLGLKQAWVEMRHAESERDRARRLLDLGLLSDADLAAAETAFQIAQVSYQQRFLELFAATPRIAVLRCVKAFRGGSRQAVTVTLRNGSAPALDWGSVGLVAAEVPMPDMERLREVRDVVVSLSDLGGTVICDPYERVVGRLAADREVDLEFGLLKDVDELQVVLRYAGREERLPVWLERDRAANVVRLSSQQFSQEADLGAAATYDLRLESYGGSGAVCAIRPFELPPEVGVELRDPDTGARLSQIRFTEGVTSRNLQLRVHLPDVVSDRVVLDQPLQLLVAAVSSELAADLPSGSELDDAQRRLVMPSSVRLELVPRGVGRLEVSAPTLFAEVRPGEPARLEVSLENIGTRRVDNVRLHADAPSDWRSEVLPPLAERLEPGGSVRIEVLLVPPASVAVGDYPVRLWTEAYTDSRRIASHDQTARIQVVAPPAWEVTALLVLLLLGTVGGLVAWGIRLTRR